MVEYGMTGSVTISASFGAGGNVVGPAVAERLGIPFLDRAIPVEVARRLSLPLQSVVAQDEKAPSPWSRLARAFAFAATPLGPQPLSEGVDAPDRFREETEQILRRVADSTGGVILGRAGMMVLRGRPDVLCVRLDGPVEDRIAQVVGDGMAEDEARAMQKDVDGARETYARVFYRTRQADPSLYHVVLDSTVLSFDLCTDIIVTAARHRLSLDHPDPRVGTA
jgi:cytidylate kinase